MASFWVVPVQLIPSFVKYQVIFAQTRNVLCCWYSWVPECGCIHNARHGPVLPFTNQIKAATGFPISEKLFPKLKDKQNSFNSIKTDLRNKSGGGWLELEAILGWNRVPRFLPGAGKRSDKIYIGCAGHFLHDIYAIMECLPVQVFPVFRNTEESFNVARSIWQRKGDQSNVTQQPKR